MQQRLPDIERTLLSAYLDGELSPAERQDAERLLESSDGARAYLRDLRAVNSLAGDAFPAIPAGLAAGGAIAGGKLSAAAIRAAATKGAITKGGLTSGWGLAGLATAAVVAVVGFNLFGSSVERPLDQKIRVAPTAEAPIAARPLPVANVDSSSFLIPAMTPAELIDFAVEGTLPLDADRERFITVTQDGESALAVSMHPATETRHQEIVDGFVATTGLRRLDSVHRIVRTALIPYSGNSVAIRSDLPMIRLQVLEQLSESMPSMPAEVRQELERVRVELQGANREAERAREVLMSGRSRVGYGAGGGNGEMRTVLYIPIESEGLRRFASGAMPQPPDPETFTLYYNRCPVVAVDPGMLEAASNAAFTRIVTDRRRTETRVASAGDPTAGAPAVTIRSRKTAPSVYTTQPPPTPPVDPPKPPEARSNTRQPVSQSELDELLRNAEKSLREARESLRRADDLQKKESETRSRSTTPPPASPDNPVDDQDLP